MIPEGKIEYTGFKLKIFSNQKKESAFYLIHRTIIILLIIIVFFPFLVCQKTIKTPEQPQKTKLALFINTGRDSEMIFRNKKNVDRALNYARNIHAEAIFVHVYSGDNFYFDDGENTSLSYRTGSAKAGCDLFAYLIEEAKSLGIKCFAWINCYAFFPGNHNLLKKYGNQVLTKDQYGRYLNGNQKPIVQDYYYRKDLLAWLEPGDLRVQDYILNVIKRLVNRYDLLDGVQLDFIRYPVQPPFIPGSRYMRWGSSMGYGDESVKRFFNKYKFYPTSENLSMGMNPGYNGSYKALLWDKWRREQVTELVLKAAEICTMKDKMLSASVFAYSDRVYFHGFQDWRKWIRYDYVDFVILMNYSIDNEMVYHIARQHIKSYPKKVWIGLGPYIMQNQPEIFQEQISDMYDLKTPGIVLFEYFLIRNSKSVKSVVRESVKAQLP